MNREKEQHKLLSSNFLNLNEEGGRGAHSGQNGSTSFGLRREIGEYMPTGDIDSTELIWQLKAFKMENKFPEWTLH